MIEPYQRRWLVGYGLTLVFLIGMAVWSCLRLASFRDPPFDFYALKADERLNVYGMTRRQEGSVKLGFAEAYAPPEIGAYGNHIIFYFGSDAFGRADDAAYFFNYWYANLSLPEIRSYLRHVEQAGRLPKKLVLVQITAPNTDNGHFIINWGNELPPDVVLGHLGGDGTALFRLRSGAVLWRVLINTLHEVLNYNTFILGIVQGEGGARVISPSICAAEDTTWLRRMPYAVQTLVGTAGGRGFYCLERTQWGALKRDGSIDHEFGNEGPPAPNEEPLNDFDRGLSAGDEDHIAREMRAIDAIGRRNGTKVVFLVPPVYETDQRDSVPNRVFDRALALVPDLAVIDDRAMYSDPSLFMDTRHPSPKYYGRLADELRRRGFVE